MRHPHTLQHLWRCFTQCSTIIAVIFLASSACAAQANPAEPAPQIPWLQELNKNPELRAELTRLSSRLKQELQYPAARGESRILPLLPESTIFYAALPNYGDLAQQTLKIFHEELQQSSALREWWQHGDMATVGPQLEGALEKVHQLFQYLGDELVVSGAMETQDPKWLLVVEARKPGLKDFLQQMLGQAAGNPKSPVRVWGQQELARAEDPGADQKLLVLVRPDFVVASLDLATLRTFNARLDRHSREFASTPFGLRVAQAYQGGATVVGAADVHKILSKLPQGTRQNHMIFEKTGFADMKYFIWEHKNLAGHRFSQTELSFTGPRHGIASWLAAPAPMGSLDFVSPSAMLVGTVLLKSPVQIFEDVKEIFGASNPSSFAAFEQSEQAMGLSLKDDLLRYLGGEITGELDSLGPLFDEQKPTTPVAFRAGQEQQKPSTTFSPVWKAILKVNDSGQLQQTLGRLLAIAHHVPEQFQEGGLTYYTLHIPSSNKTIDISYVFADGYLIAGSSRGTLAEGIRLHTSGESLGKSKKLLASLPPGHSSSASALFYEDPLAVATATMRQVSPEIAGTLALLGRGSAPPIVSCAYGEETAIRGASITAALDAGVITIAASIAVPSLLRARIAANEASAVGTVRTVDTAEGIYASTYPERGYAPDLATLGPDPTGANANSADHAGFIDATLGNASCTAGSWCEKSGFRFRLTGVCKQKPCNEYVVVATPVKSNSGLRSFCSLSDGVVRRTMASLLPLPVTVSECRSWTPLQ